MPSACFCEQLGSGWLRQPVNALSGLAFLLAALVVVRRGRRAALPYAAALAVVGVGTVFYHTSLTFWGQTADVAGMYLLATLLLMQGATPRAPGPRAWAAFAAGNLALFALLVGLPGVRRYLFALLLLAVIAVQLRGGRGVPGRALIVLALGFVVWTLDLTGVLCAPSSVLQGHAVWHLCGAIAAVLAYRAPD